MQIVNVITLFNNCGFFMHFFVTHNKCKWNGTGVL